MRVHVLFLIGCTQTNLETTYPDEAASLGGPGVTATLDGAGIRLVGASGQRSRARLSTAAEDGFVFELGGNEIRVIERGAEGRARVEGGSVRYARADGGTSIFTLAGASLEEWLVLSPDGDRVTASWTVTPEVGELAITQHGERVRIAAGGHELEVDAPFARGASGAVYQPRISAHAASATGAPSAWTIEVTVDDVGSESELLVDPVWREANGTMVTGNRLHSSALLPNGKLMIIAGEREAGPFHNGTQIYDPASGMWALGPTIKDDGYWPYVVVLRTGKVLICAPSDGVNYVAQQKRSCDLYDPLTNTMTPAASMLVAVDGATATLLVDGRVFVSGGLHVAGADPDGNPLREYPVATQIYDPSTDTWSSGPDLIVGVFLHSAARMDDGRVFLTGGEGWFGQSSFTTRCQIFDPVANTIVEAAPMPGTRTDASLTKLLDGTLLWNNGHYGTGSAAIYNPATDTWTPTAMPNDVTLHQTATLGPDGHVLVIGTTDGSSIPNEYDPIAQSWIQMAPLPSPLYWHGAVLEPSGRMAVMGGDADPYGPHYLDDAKILDRRTPSLVSAATSVHPRQEHAASVLDNGRVLVVGGLSGSTPLATADVYTPATNSWAATAPLAQARRNHTATLMRDGNVVVIGGRNATTALTRVEIYDGTSWSSGGDLPSTRYSHTATNIDGRYIFVAGGCSWAPGTHPVSLASAGIYDSRLRTFAAVASMHQGRCGHTATLLADRRILVHGGDGSSTTAEVYDFATGVWTYTGNVPHVRSTAHTMTLLPSGKVLVGGGFAGSQYVFAKDEFDPVTNDWAAPYTGGNPVVNGTATVLPSGVVAIQGGNPNGYPAFAEEPNPETGYSGGSAPPATNRRLHTATMLADGRVFLFGGVAGGPTLATAQLYDEGRNTASGARPIVSPIAAFSPGSTLSTTGSGFLRREGNGGHGAAASGFPILELQRIDNGEIVYATTIAFSVVSASFAIPPAIPKGTWLARVIVNGAPSAGQIVDVY